MAGEKRKRAYGVSCTVSYECFLSMVHFPSAVLTRCAFRPAARRRSPVMESALDALAAGTAKRSVSCRESPA